MARTSKKPTAADPVTSVVERLEEEIVFGRLRPRERLIEEDLVARFGVKRHTVRQALQELERIGFVVRQRGRGARVCEFTPTEVRDLYAVRELLEAKAASLIPLPAGKDLVKRLTALHRAHGKAVADGDMMGIYHANIQFHQVLFGACGNPYLVDAINLFAMKANVIRFYLGRDPKMFSGARDEHGEIIEALREGRRDDLVELCVRHLRPSPQVYIDTYHVLFGED